MFKLHQIQINKDHLDDLDKSEKSQRPARRSILKTSLPTTTKSIFLSIGTLYEFLRVLRVGERFHLAAMIIKVNAVAPSPVDVQLKCRRAALCPSVLLGRVRKKEELEEDTKTCFCEEDDAGTNLKSENFHGNFSQEVEKK